MLFGLSRRAATEFSFFLAVPTLVAAGAYDLVKHRDLLSSSDVSVFGVGFVAAFFSAFACVRWLIRYIATHDFTVFAWYRIAFGVIVLVTACTGLGRLVGVGRSIGDRPRFQTMRCGQEIGSAPISSGVSFASRAGPPHASRPWYCDGRPRLYRLRSLRARCRLPYSPPASPSSPRCANVRRCGR